MSCSAGGACSCPRWLPSTFRLTIIVWVHYSRPAACLQCCGEVHLSWAPGPGGETLFIPFELPLPDDRQPACQTVIQTGHVQQFNASLSAVQGSGALVLYLEPREAWSSVFFQNTYLQRPPQRDLSRPGIGAACAALNAAAPTPDHHPATVHIVRCSSETVSHLSSSSTERTKTCHHI